MPRNPDYQTLHAGTDAAATRRQVELERRELLEPHRNYQLVDCDQHYYEPDDCFTRHLESKYRNEAIEVRRDQADGLGRIYPSRVLERRATIPRRSMRRSSPSSSTTVRLGCG